MRFGGGAIANQLAKQVASAQNTFAAWQTHERERVIEPRKNNTPRTTLIFVRYRPCRLNQFELYGFRPFWWNFTKMAKTQRKNTHNW
jgi:hypothetical protein